jgi:acyl-CoA oxidase
MSKAGAGDDAGARRARVLAFMQDQQAMAENVDDTFEWESDDIATMMPTGGPTSEILPGERETASFHIQTLKEVISGKKRSQAVQDFKHLFDDNPVFDSEMDDFLSYPELAEKQIVRAAEAIKTVRENPKFMVAHMAQQVSMADMFDTGGLGIHFVAYLPFLQSQASKEQLDKWLPGARMFQYMGAYAQTELGHGSNVRGLETTATFNKETDEFVINSPTLTSMKWWPTGMYAATHGVVFAQLQIDGVNHGVFGIL